MLYVKVVDGVAKTPPLTIDRIKKQNPNISFPKIVNDELMKELGYEPVPIFQEDYVKANTNEIVGLTFPELVEGVWRRRYSVRPRPIADYEKQLNKIRSFRNWLLERSDWVEVPSVRASKSAEWCKAWDDYRTELRNITDTDDIFSIKFPKLPTV